MCAQAKVTSTRQVCRVLDSAELGIYDGNWGGPMIPVTPSLGTEIDELLSARAAERVGCPTKMTIHVEAAKVFPSLDLPA